MFKKFSLIVCMFLLLSYSCILAQNNDTVNTQYAFSRIFHNSTLLFAPKGKFFMRNTDFFNVIVGKNFGNKLEVELNTCIIPIFSGVKNLDIRFVQPISKKISIGVAAGLGIWDGSVLKIGSLTDYVQWRKNQILIGLNYKTDNTLFNINYGFDRIPLYSYSYYISIMDGSSFSKGKVYTINNYNLIFSFITKIKNNKYFFLDVKGTYQIRDYLIDKATEYNYGVNNIFGIRKIAKNNNLIDIGLVLNFGKGTYKDDYDISKFRLIPYISYSFCFDDIKKNKK